MLGEFTLKCRDLYVVPKPAILQSPPHFSGGGLGRGENNENEIENEYGVNCQWSIVNCQFRLREAWIVFNRRGRRDYTAEHAEVGVS